jgi:hypothetical protein
MKNLNKVRTLFPHSKGYIVYAGEDEPVYKEVKFINWQNWENDITL